MRPDLRDADAPAAARAFLRSWLNYHQLHGLTQNGCGKTKLKEPAASMLNSVPQLHPPIDTGLGCDCLVFSGIHNLSYTPFGCGTD